MKITTRLGLISSLTLVTLVVLAPVFYWSLTEFNHAKEDSALSSAIRASLFERASLRDLYFIFREERIRAQWDKNKEISDDLIHQAEAQFRDREDLIDLERLRLVIEDTSTLFHRIVANTDMLNLAVESRTVYEELDKRLSSQLLLKASKARDLSGELKDRSEARVEAAYRSFTLMVIGFSFVLMAATVLTSLSIVKLIHRRLSPLHDGAKKIAQGELDHRIITQGKDEFSDLGLSINSMTEKLQAFTSKLEAEIVEHKRAKDKLQLSASVFTHAREGIIITSADGTIIDVNNAFTRISGYDRGEVLGRNPRLLKSGLQKHDFYNGMWGDLITKGYWYGEVWNRRKNGEAYAEMLTISAVHDENGIIQHYVGLFSDITALKDHERQLEKIAHYDALTTLPNRILLSDRLHQAMVQSVRKGQKLAVVYIDLDGFKTINDTYGHECGDELLKILAVRMKQTLREGDTLARLGGDEFVAILQDQFDLDKSVVLLGRLLGATSGAVHINGNDLQVSASVGVTFFPQDEDVDADQLLRQADQAMYQAKVSGKNRFHFFDAEMDQALRKVHENLDVMRQALVRDEFVLYYQPKVNMSSGEIVGLEALIRWQHPNQGLLQPGQFLPAIENHPLAIDLGEWVINQALTQHEKWASEGVVIPISVNVGARQLLHPDFVDRLRIELEDHPNVDPSQLELEILETSALKDLSQATEIINQCRELGVVFALDDFGTGYSSLTYLRRLPVAHLKVDQSFVRDMLVDPEDRIILEGIIGLAKAFRCKTIVEGVETLEQRDVLLKMGYSLGQGYCIARPMPADQFPGWARDWASNAVGMRS